MQRRLDGRECVQLLFFAPTDGQAALRSEPERRGRGDLCRPRAAAAALHRRSDADQRRPGDPRSLRRQRLAGPQSPNARTVRGAAGCELVTALAGHRAIPPIRRPRPAESTSFCSVRWTAAANRDRGGPKHGRVPMLHAHAPNRHGRGCLVTFAPQGDAGGGAWFSRRPCFARSGHSCIHPLDFDARRSLARAHRLDDRLDSHTRTSGLNFETCAVHEHDSRHALLRIPQARIASAILCGSCSISETFELRSRVHGASLCEPGHSFGAHLSLYVGSSLATLLGAREENGHEVYEAKPDRCARRH